MTEARLSTSHLLGLSIRNYESSKVRSIFEMNMAIL